MTVWNLGSINIDHVFRVPRLPQPRETLAAGQDGMGLGGKGGNQSVAAARAGARTYHIGADCPLAMRRAAAALQVTWAGAAQAMPRASEVNAFRPSFR